METWSTTQSNRYIPWNYQQQDVEILPTPELKPEKDAATSVSPANPVEQGEPWITGSGGECIGSTFYLQQQTTRTEERMKLPNCFPFMIWVALDRGLSL